VISIATHRSIPYGQASFADGYLINIALAFVPRL
jgi:hypothetical protein